MVWNLKHRQYIYLIDNIVTDQNKKTSYPSLSCWTNVKIFVSQTTADIKKTNALA